MSKTEKVAGKTKETLGKAREKSSGFRKEFIEFINRGSVVDLAVGVAVGGAFTAIVNSLVNDIIMPIVGLIAGGVDFTNLAIRIPNFFGTGDEAVIAYGNFIQNVIQFLIIAWVIFMIVKAMNRINRKRDEKKATKA
ncbi:large conductance mechanosensitive channel protein MscL [Candidatus Saccharibacteria bacterium]|nr:large conductance mechanosensitive channel protein MscL [Candidatus Saccharibacteria bacterium]MBR3263740.1 large conductance mechanosensitive channel protein MscL [Candidatus Saccharibacteria bacterium]